MYISRNTFNRLPIYLRYLHESEEQGLSFLSSTVIASKLNLTAIQVRKDLSAVSSVAGKPKIGFEVSRLIRDIENRLGYTNTKDAIICGIGGLGKALLCYPNFAKYGLNIIAGFDTSDSLVNTEICGKRILPLSQLENTVKLSNAHLGIITVPKVAAQSVCDRMIKAGIKAIWNFAPYPLAVPPGVTVKNEDLAASLAVLSNQLELLLNSK